jgi:hypothetical protein
MSTKDGSTSSGRSNESVSSTATSNDYEIVTINPDEVDFKIVGNGNEADLQVKHQQLVWYNFSKSSRKSTPEL